MFITTSSFTGDVRNYVGSIEPKIVLIGGEQLAAFMFEHNVGVAPASAYESERPPSLTEQDTEGHAMRFQRARRALIQVLIFVAIVVAISALAIWLNLGPVVHSSVGL